jgi:hypothetical protein
LTENLNEHPIDEIQTKTTKRSKLDSTMLLKEWTENMKRKNGDNYEEAVIKLMWNSTAKLLKKNYQKISAY